MRISIIQTKQMRSKHGDEFHQTEIVNFVPNQEKKDAPVPPAAPSQTSIKIDAIDDDMNEDIDTSILLSPDKCEYLTQLECNVYAVELPEDIFFGLVAMVYHGIWNKYLSFCSKIIFCCLMIITGFIQISIIILLNSSLDVTRDSINDKDIDYTDTFFKFDDPIQNVSVYFNNQTELIDTTLRCVYMYIYDRDIIN